MQPYINCIPKLDTMMSSVIELHTYIYQMRSALYPVRSESDIIINKQRSQSTEQAKRARIEQARAKRRKKMRVEASSQAHFSRSLVLDASSIQPWFCTVLWAPTKPAVHLLRMPHPHVQCT